MSELALLALFNLRLQFVKLFFHGVYLLLGGFEKVFSLSFRAFHGQEGFLYLGLLL